MMFEHRERNGDDLKKEIAEETSPEATQKVTAEEEQATRHDFLMDCLNDELMRQEEERVQMAIDEDFNDHLHWTPDDAQELINRGQNPVVYNEGRLTVEWLCGTEKQARIDYKILGRERNDEALAEVKTKVVKYTDDVNMTAFHRSAAFRQCVVAGVGWLEEGINIEPGQELIYAGSADWRNVIRDSRSRELDYNKDGRYLFRKRRLDVDFAAALLPDKAHLLVNEAQTDDMDGIEDRWYLGERLTAAHDLAYGSGLPSVSRDRAAYIGRGYFDQGRRRAVDLLEAWYKVPETVKVFQDGPFAGKIIEARSEQHQQAMNDRWDFYQTVAWRMRVMICTEDTPLWDGPSPFLHNRFPLVPMWCYRRARDGMAYGVWRGMRDPQVGLNKRMSKALWAASSNRVIADKGAVDDVDEARQEFARPDAWIEIKKGAQVREVKNTVEVQTSLELADRDARMIRNAGGVTEENLGRDTNATSGKAIIARQSQGTMTTAGIFDNRRMCVQQAGQMRVSNIEQFMTAKKVIRIVGGNAPTDWLVINDQDPETGEYLNDMTQGQADYIVAEQDYRANLQQAALDSMMDLITKVAPAAPQLVINLLDLLIDVWDLPGKDQIVARVRQFNGQGDPTRKPTPEEEAAAQAKQKKAEMLDKLAIQRLVAELDELRAKSTKMNAEEVARRIESMYSALQAAQIVATVPNVAPVADVIAQGAGFKDQGGQDPNLPSAPVQQMQPQPAPMQAPPAAMSGMAPAQPLQADGAMQGIETPAADGVLPQGV